MEILSGPTWKTGPRFPHILEDESWVLKQILRWFGNRSKLPSAAKRVLVSSTLLEEKASRSTD